MPQNGGLVELPSRRTAQESPGSGQQSANTPFSGCVVPRVFSLTAMIDLSLDRLWSGRNGRLMGRIRMDVTGPEAAKGDAPATEPGPVGTTGLIYNITNDRLGWAALAVAVVLTALLQAIPESALQRSSPIYPALLLNMMFQWSFSVPIMAYLAHRGRLGWLAALYGVIAIGAAHYAAFAMAMSVFQASMNGNGEFGGFADFAGGFTGAAISFLAFLAYGKTLRTRRALALMAGGVGVLTVLAGLAPNPPVQMLYAPWQLVFGALILVLTRPRRARRLW